MIDARHYPQREVWSEELAASSAAVALAEDRLGVDLSESRAWVLRAAATFHEQLCELAESVGWEPPPRPQVLREQQNAAAPWTMTGHQPVIFHGGIAFKYDETEAFATESKSLGLAVVIDTDWGDAGSFLVPQSPTAVHELAPADEKWPEGQRTASFCEAPGLYQTARLAPEAKILETGRRAARALCELGLCESSSRFERTLKDYASLGGRPAMLANILVRKRAGVGALLADAPLSALADGPVWRTLSERILDRFEAFHTCYNRTLHAFREEHKIRGANPFPDLAKQDGACETPFWLVGDGARTAVWAKAASGLTTLCDGDGRTLLTRATGQPLAESLPAGTRLVPRAALITAFLRATACDYFVHGLGGWKYDPFTDQLMEAWWGLEPPRFAACSASQYLFPRRRAELQRWGRLKRELRDLAYNPQRHWDSGVYSPRLTETLRRLSDEKLSCVAAMRRSHAQGASAADLGKRIQSLSDQMKRLVEDEFQPQLDQAAQLSLASREAVDQRAYPWFYFRTRAA